MPPLKPTPTAIRKLRGNPGRRPYPANEPEPAIPAKCPKAPPYLERGARRVWRWHAPELHRLGLLTALDVHPLALWCVAFARWIEAEAELRKAGGLVVKSANGYPAANPYLAVARGAFKDCTTLGAEFGLTPSSRSRIEARPAPKEDPLAAFLAARGTAKKAG